MALIDFPAILPNPSTVQTGRTSGTAVLSEAAPCLASYLRSHAFRELFVEDLGWERVGGRWTISAKRDAFSVEAVAHKRGFQVFLCAADRFTLIDRYKLRAIQKQVAKYAHEHIIVYAAEAPRRQVWQWGLRLPDGKRFQHLEHPFFSNSPPPGLLARLERLRFALDEEEAVTLLDAVSRVRDVLIADAEFNLFAKRPNYARKSDELARAMARGGVQEFHEFMLFHRGLWPFFAKRWYRALHIDQDEAEQLCALGVMRAARLYDPDRGIQFATYAGQSAKRVARRLAADIRFPLRLPQYVLPTCFGAQRLQHEVLVARGPQAAREAVETMLAEVSKPVAQAWDAFERMATRESLSERREPAFEAARQIAASESSPDTSLICQEIIDELHRLVGRLGERERLMVRLYHGFDGEPLTLQAIGDRFRLTRERVRQILEQVHRRLRVELDSELKEVRRLLPS
jgi:RNA polymerase primary sigma factor